MPGILERYRDLLNIEPELELVSLNEGNTPLIPVPTVAKKTGVPGLKVFVKFEGLNPTGSFKDRGMTYAVTRAKADGAKTVICASTGNTSASAAAFATRAGLDCLVVIPKGKIAMGKLSQAMIYGATIVEIDGNFDQGLDIVRKLGDTGKVTVVNSTNPWRLPGQKSAAYEVCDALGDAPDALYIPVGNAGNITAYWWGFKDYFEKNLSSKKPQMCGYEAEGSAAIVRGAPIANPETFATAIRIGNPASWKIAEAARDESGGRIDCVTDDEIGAAYHYLAAKEGVFCEPSSAASVAGLFKAAALGQVTPESTVVCVLTGNGLKDPDSAMCYGSQARRTTLPADLAAVTSFLGL
jgi:threonine synthase